MPRLYRCVAFLACLTLSACAALAAGPTPTPRLPALHWEQRSDWISVKDRGAVGDGVADDTAAIQIAFAQIKRGTTVYFPPGTYKVTATLTLTGGLPHSAKSLVGCGRATPACGNQVR